MHGIARPSPRCALGWVAKRIKHIEVSILEKYKEEPRTKKNIILHCPMINKPKLPVLLGIKDIQSAELKASAGCFSNSLIMRLRLKSLYRVVSELVP